MSNVYETVWHNEKYFAKLIHSSEVSGRSLLYVPPHWHEDLELDFCLHGTAEVTVNGRRIALAAGQCLLVNSGDVHSLRIVQKEPYEAITLLIDFEVIRRYISKWEFFYFDLQDNINIMKECGAIMEEIWTCNCKMQNGYEAFICSKLMYIIFLLINHCIKLPESGVLSMQKALVPVQKAIQFIQQNYKNQITLQEVSQHCNFSRTYFCKYFKENTGRTFCQCLKEVRLKNAQEQLLKNTAAGITDIAYDSGFPNVKSFISAFRETFGMTPGRYRKKSLCIRKEYKTKLEIPSQRDIVSFM